MQLIETLFGAFLVILGILIQEGIRWFKDKQKRQEEKEKREEERIKDRIRDHRDILKDHLREHLGPLMATVFMVFIKVGHLQKSSQQKNLLDDLKKRKKSLEKVFEDETKGFYWFIFEAEVFKLIMKIVENLRKITSSSIVDNELVEETQENCKKIFHKMRRTFGIKDIERIDLEELI